MPFADAVFVGIDGTSGRNAFTYAALDRDLSPIAMGESEVDEVTAFVASQPSAVVAVNSPAHLCMGSVRKRVEAHGRISHRLRGVDLRAAEYDLRARGISVSGTGANAGLLPAWVQLGLALYEKLSKLGFKEFPHQQASHQWLETHPHACFCVLLGQSPLPQSTVEGRLQRALILFERGVHIRDPMTFLEEITRHRLLHGILPIDLLPPPGQLDALVAAYTAWLSVAKPAEVTRLGNRREGFITLPAATLQEKY